ncbi:MAG: hypothetical protein ABJV04_03945 [Aliiglaciecola sp.]
MTDTESIPLLIKLAVQHKHQNVQRVSSFVDTLSCSVNPLNSDNVLV